MTGESNYLKNSLSPLTLRQDIINPLHKGINNVTEEPLTRMTYGRGLP